MSYSRVLLIFAVALISGFCAAATEDPYLRSEEERQWEPVADAVYLQEIASRIVTEVPLLSVAVYDGSVFACTGSMVYKLEGGRLESLPEAPPDIKRFRVLNNALWGMAASGLYKYDSGEIEKLSDEPFVDACEVRGRIYAATRDAVYQYINGALLNMEPETGFRSADITFQMEDRTQVLMHPEKIGPVTRIASYCDTLYVLRPHELVLLDNDLVDPRTVEWGRFPSNKLRDMIALGNRLLVATGKGVAVLRGTALTVLDGESGLPYEDTTCFAEGFEEDLWIGTTWGAIRQVDAGTFHYFAGERWLPGDYVNDIAVADTTVYFATEKGLGIIHYAPYTLRKKAAYYERRLEEWGHKRMGFTHLIHKSGDGWIREISDNDGGFSAHYLVAMIYKYAVTGDPEAWEEAVTTLKALVWLEEITPMPGFPARSIWSIHGDAGKKSEGGSGGLPARWVPTEDGNFEWKGDTSSDEVGAHYYAMATFCALAPDGPEKERAKEHINRLTRHIIENGWKLRDMDGALTRWGRWDPEYLHRPYGMYARGLNGMEAQSYVTTAIGLLDEDYFRNALQQLLDWGYHEFTVRQKITFPAEDITTWDDRLAFLSYYSLIKYTEKDWLRALYLRSLERSWEIKRLEKHGWFNFLYGIMTGNDCEAEKAVQFLRDWPLDLVSYHYRNSQRTDLHPEPGYMPYAAGPVTPSPKQVSPRESEPKKLDGTMLGLDGGAGGNRSITPNAWLETYWMGRYYGLINAPETDDPALLDIEQPPMQQLGAAPYMGPQNPVVIGRGN